MNTLEEEKKHDDHGAAGTAKITVDGKKHKVRAGLWLVADLKATVGVDPAKVLAEVTSTGLKDLDDNATIGVHDDQKFVSHARSGGSS